MSYQKAKKIPQQNWKTQIPINAKPAKHMPPQSPSPDLLRIRLCRWYHIGLTSPGASITAAPGAGKGRVPCHIGTRETAVALEASCFGEGTRKYWQWSTKNVNKNVEKKQVNPVHPTGETTNLQSLAPIIIPQGGIALAPSTTKKETKTSHLKQKIGCKVNPRERQCSTWTASEQKGEQLSTNVLSDSITSYA